MRESFYCRTCKRALNRYRTAGGLPVFLHAQGQTDHEPDPVLLEDLPDAIMICDFCSADGPAWYYDVSNEAVYTKRGGSPRVVGEGDHTGRYANRVRDVSTREARRWGTRGAEQVTEFYGERWAACDGCAVFIDAGDLWGLVGRVVDAMPAKARSGKKLIPLRGQVSGLYEEFLATVKTKQPIKKG